MRDRDRGFGGGIPRLNAGGGHAALHLFQRPRLVLLGLVPCLSRRASSVGFFRFLQTLRMPVLVTAQMHGEIAHACVLLAANITIEFPDYRLQFLFERFLLCSLQGPLFLYRHGLLHLHV
jgi:hypothetical protein